MSIKALQEYTRFSKYAKYNPEAGRREFWDEQVERVFKMHRDKLGDDLYSKIKDDMEFAQRMVEKKRVLGSQRALQFGGEPILKKNPRIFNCVVAYCDRPRFFQECIYLLLCGCGCGFSVQKHHIEKLPKILTPSLGKKIYQIPDSIEGWSDALGILMCSFFDSDLTEFQKYKGFQIEFDYSLIRQEGAPLSSGGKAPGPDGLMRALEKIRYLLNKVSIHHGKLRPIDAYDVCMHASDAVLSGGIRRSASLALFSPDDEEMIKAKTGSWFIENPQRGRSNNSVLLVRNETTKEQFANLMNSVKEFGEPGFIWTDNKESLYNPCVTLDGWVHTSNGPRTVADLVDNQFKAIVNGNEYNSTYEGFFKTDSNREIYLVKTSDGYEFKSTKNHKFMVKNGEDSQWKKLSEINIGDEIILHNHSKFKWNGFGTEQDGVIIGSMDGGYCNSKELDDKFERSSCDFYKGFIKGCFDMNGDVVSDSNDVKLKLTYKSTNNLKRIQRMMLRMGIRSTINNCDLFIKSNSLIKYHNYIGFSNSYKTNQLKNAIAFMQSEENTNNYTATVESIEFSGVEDVYDCTIEEVHAFDLNGFYAHNCVEIGFCAFLDLNDERNVKLMESNEDYKKSVEIEKKRQNNDKILSGWAFCNLCEINMKKCKSEEEFMESCRAASIIGSVQASYSHFPYLGGVTDMIVKREALLGVSMTGMADSPDIAFNAEMQRKGAKVVLETNEKISKIIGTNICARGTCVKPAGCQTKDTMVSTENGILRLDEIGDIHGQEWQNHEINVYTDEGVKKSTKFFVNNMGVKSPTKKIMLDSGIELETTTNHKFKVIKNGEYIWESVENIHVGDILPYSLGEYNGGTLQKLNKIKVNWHKSTPFYRRREITQPEFLDEDLAWLIGLYFGDGTNHKSGIRIHGDKTEYQDLTIAKERIKKLFNVECVFDEDKREGNRTCICAGSIHLLEFLRHNGIAKDKSYNICVPKIIRQSPRKVIEAFIDGFRCADGSNKSERDLIYVTTSKQFATELVMLLRAVGKDCKMREMKPTKTSFGTRMRYWVQERKGRHGEVKKITSYRRAALQLLDSINRNNLYADKVVSIIDSENYTFDIEVNENHTYIANSYISHNSTSCILGSASGIHPHHAKRYLRRVQANKLEVPLQHFQKYNPLAIENSVWSANNTDVVVTFLCEVPDGVKTKNQVNAITLLENVKLTQQNWVEYGTRVEECIRPWLRHNVSNTCTVKPEEWDDVENFIYNNKAWFAGISLLPASGDKDYPQAPFTAVYTPTETVRKYGDGSLFGSGLIVDGHRAFDNDLWAACDCALGVGEVLDIRALRAKIEVAFSTNGQYWKDEGLSPESPEKLLSAWLKHNVKNYNKKIDWVRRAKQFAIRYFNDDLREMTYCLKDIYNWKVWCDLSREYVEVDWSQCFETEQGAMDIEAGSACSGGKCELGDLGIMIAQKQQDQEK